MSSTAAISFFASPTGFIVTSVAVMFLILLPIIIGTYVTKLLVVKCREESLEHYTWKFNNTKNFFIVTMIVFEVIAVLLAHKYFGLGQIFLDPITKYPSTFPQGLEYRGWLMLLFVMSVVLAATYGFGILMGKGFIGDQTYEDDLSYFYKQQDAYVGATVIILLIFLMLALIVAKLSLLQRPVRRRSRSRSVSPPPVRPRRK